MRTILSALILIGLASYAMAQQVYETVTVLPGSTYTVAANSTSNHTQVVNVRSATEIGIVYSFALTAAGSDNMTFIWDRSVDGTTFSQFSNSITNVVAAFGVTNRTYFVSVDTDGARDLKLRSVQNGHATAVLTNLSVKVGIPRR